MSGAAACEERLAEMRRKDGSSGKVAERQWMRGTARVYSDRSEQQQQQQVMNKAVSRVRGIRM